MSDEERKRKWQELECKKIQKCFLEQKDGKVRLIPNKRYPRNERTEEFIKQPFRLSFALNDPIAAGTEMTFDPILESDGNTYGKNPVPGGASPITKKRCEAYQEAWQKMKTASEDDFARLFYSIISSRQAGEDMKSKEPSDCKQGSRRRLLGYKANNQYNAALYNKFQYDPVFITHKEVIVHYGVAQREPGSEERDFVVIVEIIPKNRSFMNEEKYIESLNNLGFGVWSLNEDGDSSIHFQYLHPCPPFGCND